MNLGIGSSGLYYSHSRPGSPRYPHQALARPVIGVTTRIHSKHTRDIRSQPKTGFFSFERNAEKARGIGESVTERDRIKAPPPLLLFRTEPNYADADPNMSRLTSSCQRQPPIAGVTTAICAIMIDILDMDGTWKSFSNRGIHGCSRCCSLLSDQFPYSDSVSHDRGNLGLSLVHVLAALTWHAYHKIIGPWPENSGICPVLGPR